MPFHMRVLVITEVQGEEWINRAERRNDSLITEKADALNVLVQG